MITHISGGLRDIHIATNGSILFASPVALSVMKSAMGSGVSCVHGAELVVGTV